MFYNQKTFCSVLHRFIKVTLIAHGCHKEDGKKLKIWVLKSLPNQKHYLQIHLHAR